MIDRKEIELLIRSRLQGGADIKTITKSIADLERQIDSQAAAAKRGESNIDELKASLEQLKQVQQQLTQRAEAIGYFQRLSDAVQKTDASVTRAGLAYQKYSDKVKSQGEVTEKEAERLAKLSAAYERSQVRLAKQRETLEQLGKSLTEVGVDVANLVTSENQLRDAAANLGLTIQRGQQAISTYASDVRAARQADIEAAKALDQFTSAEQKATAARLARARAEQEFNERVSSRKAQGVADTRQFDEQARINQQTALSAEFVKRWAAQLDALDKNKALAKQADDAEKTVRQYSTLARAATDLSPKIVSIRDAVDSIINPSANARTTLGGVEEGIAKLTRTIQEIKGPVKDANALYKELGESQKALASQASLVDSFRRQMEALRAARTEMQAAKAQVAQYAAAVRQGGESGAQFSKALADAQGRVKAASEALNQQLGATRAAKTALREAGIETSNLANAEQRLLGTTQATKGAIQQLTAAVDQYGNAQARAAGKGGAGMFGDDGRTTLSLLQRIRGQVLALAAAYVGVQGAASLAGDVIEASNKRAATKSVLGVALGTTDKKQVDDEYEYVRGQSERIGLVFTDTAQQYAKFATAAAKSGRSRQEIRYIFEAFAEGGRVLNLTTDSLNGVFLALEQIFSKGRLGAEELRQQLGERLPGVFEVAQKALRDQFPDLNKAMQEGKVGAEQLIKVAEAYRKLVADQLPGATKSMLAEQARLTNAVNEFKLSVADSGFATAYLEAVQKITVFLKSDDGRNFAKSLSDAFTAVANVIIFLVTHLDELKLVLGTIIGLWAGFTLKRQIGELNAMRKALLDTTTEVSGLQKAFLAFQAFIVGWNIGSYLYEKFDVVRLIGIQLVTNFDKAWTIIKYGAQIAIAETIPMYFEDMSSRVLNTMTFLFRKILGFQSTFAKAVGADELAKSIDNAINLITFGVKNGTSARVAQLKAQMTSDLAAIQKIAEDSFKYEGSQRSEVRVLSGLLGKPTDKPPPGPPSKTGPSDAEIKKRASEIEAITRALEQLDAKIDRTQTDTLSKQLEAVDETYQALARRIAKLGGSEAKVFLSQLETAVGELKLQITRKFNDKIAAEQETLQSKLEGLEAAAGRKNKTDLDARLQAVEASYAATYRDIAAFRAKLELNNRDTGVADEMVRRADLAKQEQKNLETQKFYKDELLRQEQEVNAALQNRSARLKAIHDELEAGLIDQKTADEQTRATIESMQPEINSLTEAAIAFAESIRGAFDPILIDTFISKMKTAKASSNGINETFKQMAKTIDDAFVDGAVNALDKVGQALGEIALGQKSWGEGIVAIREAFKQFAADFLRMIAQMILKQLVLNALQGIKNSTGGTFGSFFASLIGAGVGHEGGVVGQSINRTRQISPTWFANAPRYHESGLVGVAADEYPAILKKNEEILKASSPRNILNGGAAARPGAQQQKPESVRFVLVDDRTKVPEAMAAPEGERVVLEHLRRNVATVRQWLKG